MKYLGMAFGGILLTCSGCVVHQAVPVAMPSNQAAPPAAAAQNCREFQSTVTVGGTQQPAHGTSCQQPDGSWRIVSQSGSSSAVAAAPVAPPPAYPVYPAPAYVYPYYGYPAYYGPSVGIGFRFGGRWR
jgi:hypothetical protein